MKANQTKTDNQSTVQKKENTQEVENKLKNPFLSEESLSNNPFIAEGQNSNNPWVNPNQISTNPFLPKDAKSVNPWINPNQVSTNPFLPKDAKSSVNPFLPIQKKEDTIQAKENTSDANTSASKMPAETESKMSDSFGVDFSGVNIHKDSDKASELNALAFTQGTNIHFAKGQYDTNSQKGLSLLGHELTHVVQQSQGKVQPTTQMKGININEESALEKEADQMGEKLNTSNYAQNLKTNNHSLSFVPDNSTTIQLKRNKPVDNQEIIKNLDPLIKENISEANYVDEQTKANAFWEEADRVYEANKDRGRRYKQQLEDVIVKSNNRNPDFLEENNAKKALFEKRLRENYVIGAEKKQNDKYKAVAEGFAGERKEMSKYPSYNNEIDLKNGTVSADYNMAARLNGNWEIEEWNDEALKDDHEKKLTNANQDSKKGLPNSEILWQQYKLATEKEYPDKEEDRNAALQRLVQIKRDTVINSETKVVMLMINNDKNVLNKWDCDGTWTADKDEFLALLGTPNGNSSAHILIDHIQELRKTLKDATVHEANDIVFTFKKIPPIAPPRPIRK